MNSTESLGNDNLLFDHDPFISGATSSQENDNMFGGLFDDTTLDMNAPFNGNVDGNGIDDFGDFSQLDAMLFPEQYAGSSGMDYNQFLNFDFGDDDNVVAQDGQVETSDVESTSATTTVNPSTKPTGEQQQKVTEDVGEVTAPETNAISNVQSDQPDVDNNKVSEVQEATQGIINEMEHDVDYNKDAYVPALRVPNTNVNANDASPNLQNRKIKYIVSSATGYRPMAVNASDAPSLKQKALFPVKVLPTNRTNQSRNASVRVHPYAYEAPRSAFQPRYRVVATQPAYEPFNENMAGNVEEFNGQYGESDEYYGAPEPVPEVVPKPIVMRKGTSKFIPRDNASHLIKCNMCSSSFSTKLGLEFHEVERHSRVYAFKCNLCSDMYSSLKGANLHITTMHKAPTAPMYDKSILGNGLDGLDKRTSQRRMAGMISSFMKKYLTKLGLLTGCFKKDTAIIKEYSKKLYRPPPPAFKSSFDNPHEEEDYEATETSNMNDMLRKEYIYGPHVYRVPIESVNQARIVYGVEEEEVIYPDLNYEEDEQEEQEEQEEVQPIIKNLAPLYTNPPETAIVIRYPPPPPIPKRPTAPIHGVSSNYRYTLNSYQHRTPNYAPTTEESLIHTYNDESYGTTGRQRVYKVRTVARKVPVNEYTQPSSTQYYSIQ